MASVADCAKTHFERYYDSVMPLLRHLLSSASQKSHQLLRAKALECISLVGMAVGRDRFRADAHEVMQFMQALQVGHAPIARFETGAGFNSVGSCVLSEMSLNSSYKPWQRRLIQFQAESAILAVPHSTSCL